jgi:DNA invertase Pin-like site-specific DNA recombinase
MNYLTNANQPLRLYLDKSIEQGGDDMKVGYVRVSSYEQNTDRQLVDEPLDKVFTDRVSGATTTNREQLQAMIEFVREGDIVVVHSMDRLARNLDDLKQVVNKLTGKGVIVQFKKEGLKFTGEADNAMSKLLLNVMGAFADFERSLIKERQMEGIAQAKAKGDVYKGRKKALSDVDVARVKAMLADGATKTAIAKELGVSRETLYKYLV